MDWIVEGIAIGSRRDVLDRGYLQSAGIEAVLQLHGPHSEPLAFPFAREVKRCDCWPGA
jgi:hypothetical protein